MSNDIYYAYINNEQKGPIPYADLLALAKQGFINGSTFISKNGGKYFQAALIPEFGNFVNGEADPQLKPPATPIIAPPPPLITPAIQQSHGQNIPINQPTSVDAKEIVQTGITDEDKVYLSFFAAYFIWNILWMLLATVPSMGSALSWLLILVCWPAWLVISYLPYIAALREEYSLRYVNTKPLMPIWSLIWTIFYLRNWRKTAKEKANAKYVSHWWILVPPIFFIKRINESVGTKWVSGVGIAAFIVAIIFQCVTPSIETLSIKTTLKSEITAAYREKGKTWRVDKIEIETSSHDWDNGKTTITGLVYLKGADEPITLNAIINRDGGYEWKIGN